MCHFDEVIQLPKPGNQTVKAILSLVHGNFFALNILLPLFDKYCTKRLLYASEKEQLKKLEITVPSECYGVEHLLRLITYLPNLFYDLEIPNVVQRNAYHETNKIIYFIQANRFELLDKWDYVPFEQ